MSSDGQTTERDGPVPAMKTTKANPNKMMPSAAAAVNITARSAMRSTRPGSANAAIIEPPPKQALFLGWAIATYAIGVPPSALLTTTTVLTMTMAPAAATARFSASKPRSRGVAR